MSAMVLTQNRSAINPSSKQFLSPQLAELTAEGVLHYFQNRTGINYFPLSPGKQKQVTAAEKILENEFEFNNEAHKLKEQFDWQLNPSLDMEWLILLHKFYYVKDLAGAYDFSAEERFARKWVSLTSSWITQTPDGFIDSQVTGRRLQQWLLAYQYFVPKCRSVSVTADFFLAFIASIHSQTQYLCRHLTPEGNHRTIELYAIFLVAVIFPELQDATWFLNFSKQELIKNLREDFLPDGVHRELSTDYHHIVLKNCLRIKTLADLNEIELADEFDEILEKALQFSLYIHKPDGMIPSINDGDSTSYLTLLKKASQHYPSEELRFITSQGNQGKPPSQRSRGFTDSGYFILRSDWTQEPFAESLYLFFDCAQLGFGSHGHYDLLNFEMAAFGHSLIVDPGRYTYSESNDDGINWRRVFKSTAYHNTIAIDGKDQAPYRCERPDLPEPQATLKKFVTSAGFDFLQGQALSYEYSVRHERIIIFAAQEYWLMKDNLDGTDAEHRYDMHLHLSPDANNKTSRANNPRGINIDTPHLIIAQPSSQNIESSIEKGFVSPEYGVKEEAPIIKFSQSSSSPTCFQTVLYPYRTNKPKLQLTQIPVYLNGQVCDMVVASALLIKLESPEKNTQDILFITDESLIAANFVFADIQFSGQVLYLRRDHSNRISILQGITVNYLEVSQSLLLKDLQNPVNTSFYKNRLELTENNGFKQISLENCQLIPTWHDIKKHWC